MSFRNGAFIRSLAILVTLAIIAPTSAAVAFGNCPQATRYSVLNYANTLNFGANKLFQYDLDSHDVTFALFAGPALGTDLEAKRYSDLMNYANTLNASADKSFRYGLDPDNVP